MIDFTHAQLKSLSVHRIGNKSYEDQPMVLSERPIEIHQPELQTILSAYILKHFELPDYFAFSATDNNFGIHPLHNLVLDTFEMTKSFHTQSREFAQHLYDCTTHPNIKSGDLLVAHFTDFVFDDELVHGIAMVKIEKPKPFVTLNENYNQIDYHLGIDLGKVEKGCLIFNTLSEDGYRLQVIDGSTRAFEIQHWKDHFLKVKSVTSDFLQTKNYMDITKSYVTNQLKTDFDLGKADQIDMLNKTANFFNDHEKFDEHTFSNMVFDDPNIVESFKEYKDNYIEAHNIDVVPEFEISKPAVKKYQRMLRSIIKLDKNFHIYIHGDKEKIEKGTDPNGRKYYKLFFDSES